MIVVTGAAGFIGSCMLSYLQQCGFGNLVAVDAFSRPDKMKNLQGIKDAIQVERSEFPQWLAQHANRVQGVFHLGARTDTTEQSEAIFLELNLNYSKTVWELCSKHHIPLIYASSAATYGNGGNGYSDDPAKIPSLVPMNPYGWSKQHFDAWVLQQENTPFFWAGFKFFNVYGPNEYHKGRMASVVYHAYQQIRAGEPLKLFRSHRPDYADGMQLRDFIYVGDVVRVMLWFMENRTHTGIYNLGSGTARSFLDLGRSVFDAMGEREAITFIDMPTDIRDTYQYYTEADLSRLADTGCPLPKTSLEAGISQYVQSYLQEGRYF